MDIANVKLLFFDRLVVMNAADRATIKVLSRFGAFVRQRARTSIRKRKGISDPGSPPSSHVGTLKESILFSYDPERKSVVIGPIPFRGSGQGAKALEEGGSIVSKLRKGRALQYRARPFMRPAFEAELPKVAGSFKDMVRA